MRTDSEIGHFVRTAIGPRHDRSPYKDSNIGHFCEYWDHGRSLNKEDYDYGSNPIKS